MEFTRLSVIALICLAVVGNDASQYGEDYWHSVWPNTPLPKTLSDLLMPYSEIPIKAKEEKQYWTVFFEHDLYPGKQMSLGIHEHSDILHQHFQPKFTKEVSRPFGVRRWDTTKKVAQPFGIWAWETAEKVALPFGVRSRDIAEKVAQPFGIWAWENAEKVAQPFGVRSRDTAKKVAQPFGIWAWENAEKVAQPFGVRSRDTAEKVAQPFGIWAWETVEKVAQPFRVRSRDTAEKVAQPFGIWAWENAKKVAQPFGVRSRDTSEKVVQPFRVRAWPLGIRGSDSRKKENQPIKGRTSEPEKENIDDYCGRPSAIGEEKYCALSLKSMMDFAISKLGTNIKVISSSFAQNHDQYVVEEVRKIGDKAVMCHRLNFEKVVFYCHQINATTAYMVPLVTSDGIKAEALTICHHDTRGMNPDVLYDVLKVKPGTIPVCHFVGNKAVAWVPNRDASN